jgi:hypothetical protein
VFGLQATVEETFFGLRVSDPALFRKLRILARFAPLVRRDTRSFATELFIRRVPCHAIFLSAPRGLAILRTVVM